MGTTRGDPSAKVAESACDSATDDRLRVRWWDDIDYRRHTLLARTHARTHARTSSSAAGRDISSERIVAGGSRNPVSRYRPRRAVGDSRFFASRFLRVPFLNIFTYEPKTGQKSFSRYFGPNEPTACFYIWTRRQTVEKCCLKNMYYWYYNTVERKVRKQNYYNRVITSSSKLKLALTINKYRKKPAWTFYPVICEQDIFPRFIRLRINDRTRRDSTIITLRLS